MTRIRLAPLALTILFVAISPALAQSTVPNPLRPKPAETQRAEPAKDKPSDVAATDKPAKPKRERSAKQKQGDDDMRACGASWRAEKATLTANGTTWRGYLKECRAQKKAARV
jgi:hypothetical protein